MYCANGEIRIYEKNGGLGFYFVFRSPVFFKLILWFGRKSSQVLLFDCLELVELSVFSPVAYTVLFCYSNVYSQEEGQMEDVDLS